MPQLKLLALGIQRLLSTTGRLGVSGGIGIVGVGTVGVTVTAEGNEGGSYRCPSTVGTLGVRRSIGLIGVEDGWSPMPPIFY